MPPGVALERCMYYQLRHLDEILEELRILGIRKRQLEQEYRVNIQDIVADASVLKAELDLLKSLGKID